MKTAQRMTRKVVVVTPQDGLARARDLMDSGNFRQLPVVRDGKLVGIISYNDIWRSDDPETIVEKAMTRDPVTVAPTTTVEEAVRLMLNHKIGAVPVVLDGKPVGILSTSDILEAFLEIDRSEAIAGLLGLAIGHWHLDF